MKKLSAKGQKWLKAVHIFLAAGWVGAGVTLLLMGFCMEADTGGERFGLDRAMKFIDDFIIIPAANGTLLTAILYALFTGWGWFKHRWITVKWIICVGGILFGTFWLGPWLNTLPPISQAKGLEALNDPAYTRARFLNLTWGTVQVASLLFALVISTLKPWKKKK